MTLAEDGRADTAAPPRPLSTLHFILIVAALTVAAGGIGFLAGLQILSSAEDSARGKGGEPAAMHGEPPRMESAKLKPLAPIVTNLAERAPTWIRLEASLVFDDIPQDADPLAARISEDIVAFLRTVSIKQIEGAKGFQNLSEDLNERVRVRSSGRVRELIIQGLIVE
jgi:flagellar FliL protein